MGLGSAKREIWFRWNWRGLWPSVTTVHWKGYALSVAALVVVAGLAFASERDFRFLALYWLAAFVFVVIYWVLVLDHAEPET